MKDMLKSELDDIKTSYELLIDGIEIFEAKIRENYIPYFSMKGDMERVKEGAKITEEIRQHMEKLQKLNEYWRSIIKAELSAEEVEEQEDINDSKEAVDRTSWHIEDDNIRIETVRKDGNSSYPNIIPRHIFKDITMSILDQFEKYDKKFFKKSGISVLMKDKIIADTNYKKSPDTVVYSVIKVLLKEDILKRNKNYKSIYTLDMNSKEVREWVKSNIC